MKKYFLIEDAELKILQNIANELYSSDMSQDDMHRYAHAINEIISACSNMIAEIVGSRTVSNHKN